MPSSPTARWLVRRSIFRQKGLPHTLVVLSDVSRALREEERSAWQRLIRVLGHELNNSMAPIKSIAGSLSARVSEMQMTDEQKHDFERGLAIIETRAASLNRFLQAYRKLAQMPSPSLRMVSLSPIVDRVAGLETRVRVTVLNGPEVELMLDPDQFEQMLINLVKNAADAALEGQGNPEVSLRWEIAEKDLVMSIEDNGSGLLNTANVFVPFYTTKPEGSGIGLVLSRQIAETHGGSIELMNRPDTRGCRVKVVLPGLNSRRERRTPARLALLQYRETGVSDRPPQKSRCLISPAVPCHQSSCAPARLPRSTSHLLYVDFADQIHPPAAHKRPRS